MMQADSLDFTSFSIQHETTICIHLDSSDTVLHGLCVEHLSLAAICNDANRKVIKLWVFW